MPDEKKVDEGWKKKVQEEKEALEPRDEEPMAKPEGEAREAAEPKPAGEKPLEDKVEQPKPEFSVLVSSLATQALIGLGQIEHPISKKKEVDLDSAEFSIDLLQMLADKTRGNLTGIEKRFIETILYDLRMKFVDASK